MGAVFKREKALQEFKIRKKAKRSFIRFHLFSRGAEIRYRRLSVMNHKGLTIGVISYWPRWKRWIFEPSAGIILSADCLAEITRKLEEMPEVR